MLISGTIASVLCALYCGAFGINMFKQSNIKAGLICLAMALYTVYMALRITIM